MSYPTRLRFIAGACGQEGMCTHMAAVKDRDMKRSEGKGTGMGTADREADTAAAGAEPMPEPGNPTTIDIGGFAYPVISCYKAVSEVAAKLTDRNFCAPHVVKVNKGSSSNPRYLDVIEWHTALRMLTDVFGPFGFDLRITGSTSDYANGIYTVDMELTGRALDDATGTVVSLVRPGRGLGLVSRSAITSDAEHDRQAHGAKSDAITNATKALGDGFGLYLYQKKQPNQSQQSSQAQGQGQGQGQGYTAPTTSVHPSGPPAVPSDNLGPRPSVKQLAVLAREGYPEDFVATLQFSDWKAVLDAIFSHQPLPIRAPGAAADIPF